VSYNFSEKCAQKIKNAQLKNEIEDESCRIRDPTTDLSWAFLGIIYEPDKSFTNKDKYAGELKEMAQFKKQLTAQFQTYTPLHILNADQKGRASLNVLWQRLLCNR